MSWLDFNDVRLPTTQFTSSDSHVWIAVLDTTQMREPFNVNYGVEHKLTGENCLMWIMVPDIIEVWKQFFVLVW